MQEREKGPGDQGFMSIGRHIDLESVSLSVFIVLYLVWFGLLCVHCRVMDLRLGHMNISLKLPVCAFQSTNYFPN